LASYLDMSASGTDVTLLAGTTIDTATSSVLDVDRNPIAIPSALVDNTRVLFARSFVLSDVMVVNQPASNRPALALVTAGPITIQGTLSATGRQGVLPGGGGGAIQIVSRTSITLAAGSHNTINVGGGGGDGGSSAVPTAGGGGGGGAILLESPIISVGAEAVLAANGGGGGGCFAGREGAGEDGPARASPASGGVSSDNPYGGLGGWAMSPSGAGGTFCNSTDYSAGGGGLGRIDVRAAHGGFTLGGVISGVFSTTNLALRRRPDAVQ
jgi:hypothetical protein